MGFISDLLGGAADLVGGLFGGDGGGGGGLFGSLFGGDDGGIFGLGMNIFGGGSGGGLFSSPIFGNILGAVGGALMQPTPDELREEAEAISHGRAMGDIKATRESYGLPAKPPSTSNGLLTPRRRKPGSAGSAEAYL